MEGEEVEVLRDIWRAVHNGEKEDSVVKAAEELRKGKTKVVRAAEWRETNGLLQFHGKRSTSRWIWTFTIISLPKITT